LWFRFKDLFSPFPFYSTVKWPAVYFLAHVRRCRVVSCRYLRVFGEFEDAKDAENANDDERSAALGHLTVAFRLLDDEHNKVCVGTMTAKRSAQVRQGTVRVGGSTARVRRRTARTRPSDTARLNDVRTGQIYRGYTARARLCTAPCVRLGTVRARQSTGRWRARRTSS